MEDTKRIRVTMADDQGHFYLDGKLYKLQKYQRFKVDGPSRTFEGVFIEVDPEEYDNRIENLTKRVASYPQVILTDLIKDALYDMQLAWLDRLEKRLDEEDKKSLATGQPARVETKRGPRGTCVELHVCGRYAAQLRV